MDIHLLMYVIALSLGLLDNFLRTLLLRLSHLPSVEPWRHLPYRLNHIFCLFAQWPDLYLLLEFVSLYLLSVDL